MDESLTLASIRRSLLRSRSDSAQRRPRSSHSQALGQHGTPNSLRRSQRLINRRQGQDSQSRGKASESRGALCPAQQRITQSITSSTIGHSESSVRDIFGTESPNGGFVVAFESRPPDEIRTGTNFPPMRISINFLSAYVDVTDKPISHAVFHAAISLWSADGQTAVSQVGTPALRGHPTRTFRVRPPSSDADVRLESMFRDVAITQIGYYSIRIAILQTPALWSDGENRFGSPRHLMSINSGPIHVHGFAPARLVQSDSVSKKCLTSLSDGGSHNSCRCSRALQ